MTELLWLIPALPLAGAIVNALFGRQLPRTWIAAIGIGSVTLAFILALLQFSNLIGMPAEARVVDQKVYTWVTAGEFNADVSFLLDPLSAIMLLVVTGVGALIHLYSAGYMAEEPDYARFFTYMNLFVFSMLLLVLADNYLLLFVGWELVGLCSYLLIGFWYTRDAARSAAVKAFVTNRVGDFGFVLGVIYLWNQLGTLNYAEVFAKAPQQFAPGGFVVTAITLLLFVGATGKSAQIPLYVWLPDAMEGPTPVSALIHAATMVTAGVYMVARSHVLFSLAPVTLQVVAIIGTATALFAATIALVQTDLKRLLAYSTISQLGYMFLGLGVGAYAAGIFHLMTHAFFKALLFLGAGSVMHAMNNVIDMRRLGGLRAPMRITYYTFLIGSLALAGFPLLSGFFSKDAILASAFLSGNYGLWILGILTSALTAFYIFRGVFLTFHGEPRWASAPEETGAQDSETKSHETQTPGMHGHGSGVHPHESPGVMWVPLVVLAGLAIVGGYVGLPAVLGANLFDPFLAPLFGEPHAEEPGLGWILIAIPTLASLLGIGLAYLFYIRDTSLPTYLGEHYRWAYNTLANKYYVDRVYDAVIARPGLWVSNAFWQVFDRGFIDGAANGIAGILGAIGRGIRRVQAGYARGYALAMLVGVVLVIAALAFR